MKRIIEGATYNTDTATAVAEASDEDEDTGATTTSILYQSRAGIYFHVDEQTIEHRDRFGEVKSRVSYEWYVVGDAAKARAWCEQHSLTIIRDIEDMPDEAIAGEKLATVYLRVTPTLKSDLDEAASDANVSGNLWATRCLERCLSYRHGRNLRELVEIGEIASIFATHNDGDWDRETCIEALSEIWDLTSKLADKLCNCTDAFTEIASSYIGDLSIDEIRSKFGPYKE